MEYAVVDMDLGDCAVPPIVVTSCIRGVQSCISAAGYKKGSFFTQHTMESIRKGIAGARGFMSLSTFDPWDGICRGGNSAFVERYCSLFDTHLNRKKEESYQILRGNSKGGGDPGIPTASCSKAPSPNAAPGAFASDVESTSSSVRRSEVKLHSSLVSLLGRKREEKGQYAQYSKSQKGQKGKKTNCNIGFQKNLVHPRKENENQFSFHFIV